MVKKQEKRSSYQPAKAKKLLLASMVAATAVGAGAVIGEVDKAEAAVQYYWDKYEVNKNIRWSAERTGPSYIQGRDNTAWFESGLPPVGTGSLLNGYTHIEWDGNKYIGSGGSNTWGGVTFYLHIQNTDQRSSYISGRANGLGEVSATYYYRTATHGTPTRGALVSRNIIGGASAFPNNQPHTDGYWYVRGEQVNAAPTKPSLNVPSVQFEHGDKHIIGFSSTDPNGDTITYTLESSNDGGKTWSQLYKGTGKSYTYTVPKDKTQVQFRVRASDGKLDSAYTTSAQKSIREVQYYWSKYTNVVKTDYTESPWEVWQEGIVNASNEYSSGYGSYTIVDGKYKGGGGWYEEWTAGAAAQGLAPKEIYDVFDNGKKLWKREVDIPSKHKVYQSFSIYQKVLTPGKSYNAKGSLIQNNIQGGINLFQHGKLNPDGYWYERGQRVLSEDVTPPIIELIEQTDYDLTSTVTVKTHDLGKVTSVKWAKGNQPISYFTSNGTSVTGGKFTVSENGEYTVYAVDDKGNAAVEVINVTKVNAKPIVSFAEVTSPYIILDEKNDFNVIGNAYDPDEHDMTVKATHQNAKGTSSVNNGHFELTLKGVDYVNGFYTDPIQIVANDGFVDGIAYQLKNPIIVRVNDAAHYNNQLHSHVIDAATLSLEQHKAFYEAYESVFAYEKERTSAFLANAKEKIKNLKSITSISESETLTDWNNRLDLVTATVATETAEETLVKSDYENARILVDSLVESQDKTELLDRIAELKRYHTAKDALTAMEEKPAIVDWDKIKEAQSFIDVVENKTNKSDLQKQLNNIIKNYMSNITTVTPEDLENFETENVDPELGDMYDEYLDAFKPLGEGSNAQDLVDFVNALKLALQDLTQSQVDTLHSKVPEYAQSALQSVTDAVDALLDYRQTFLRDDSKDSHLDSSIKNVSYAITNDYMITMKTAMQEVIEYNVTHDDDEKAEGVAAIVPLWEGQLKTDMQAYLDNGIPEIIVLEDPYEYINDGSFDVVGSINDTNDSAHTVVVTFGDQEKTVKSTNGTFSVTFDGIAEGVYENNINIKVSDALTTKSHTVTTKPVITVSDDVELFKRFAKALSNDLGQPFNEITNDTLQALKTLFDDTVSTNIDSSDRQIRDLENAAQALSGQEEGELETLVKSIFRNIRLEWLIKHYPSATVEDFAWAGVDGVTPSNINDLKKIMDDYVAQFTDSEVVTPGLSDYQDWLELQSRIAETRSTIESAESLTTKDELQGIIEKAETLLETIPDWLSAKQDLQSQLNSVIDYYQALDAVIKAETSFDQNDKDEAQQLLDVLPDSEKKTSLQNRLDALQIVIDAILAVEKAETSLDEEDKVTAQGKVDLISDDNPKKEELQNRLNAISLIKDAIKAVEDAEASLNQEDKDAAQELVDALPDGEIKDELLDRLNDLQNVLDKRSELEIATKAVEKAESTYSQSDKDAAQELVDQLEDGSEKDELLERLDELQKILDSIVEIESAVAAAEASKEQEDVDIAQDMLDELTDSDTNDIKSALQDRLDEVNRYIEAEKAVTNAENNHYQRLKDEAQALVDNLKDGDDKQALQDRLNELQDILDGKKTDLLDEIINNPNAVTPEDLADYTDETVYEELMPDYMEEMGNIGESITKDQVKEVVRLINSLELAKRSMLEKDIAAYQKDLDQSTIPTKTKYPKPDVMRSIATYTKNDNELDNVIALIAAELNRSVEEINEEIKAILEGNKEQLTGFYVVTYQTETGDVVESNKIENIPFGNVDVIANVPKGYELIGDDHYSFELTDENKGIEVVFIVKEAAAVEEGKYIVKYELEDGTIVSESTISAAYGEVTVNAEVPEGFILIGESSHTFELTEDNNEYEVIFTVKPEEAVIEEGNYNVKYQLADGTVVSEKTISAAYGKVTVIAEAPKGYILVGDNSYSFDLSENNNEYEVIFIVAEKAVDKGEYTVKYQLADGTIISESTLKATFGELTVVAEVPEGYVLAENEPSQQTFEFDENTNLEIVFTVMQPDVITGTYFVQYVLDDYSSVIKESTFTSEYGDVSVLPVVPEGYKLVVTEQTEKHFVLNEDSEGTIIEFVIEPFTEEENKTPEDDEVVPGQNEINNNDQNNNIENGEEQPSEPNTTHDGEIKDETPEQAAEANNDSNEQIISDTLGVDTQFVRSLVQVASLDDSYLTSSPFVANNYSYNIGVAEEDHAQYLYDALYALANVKAYLDKPTDEYKDEVVSIISSKLHDGAYKKLLLSYLDVDITDVGDDGEPDLTPVHPTPPTQPNPPVIPEEPEEVPEEPVEVDPEPDYNEPSEKPNPWYPQPQPPVVDDKDDEENIEIPEVPSIPDGETKAEDNTEKIEVDEVENGYGWTISNPTEKVYTLTADGIEIIVPFDIDASKWQITWKHIGNEHYQLSVIADGKAVSKFSSPIKVSKLHDPAYLLRSINKEYNAMPYTYKDNKFKFETKTTDGAFYFSETKVTFKDITKIYSKKEIEELASRHIVYGTHTDKYSPNAKLTRAQFAAMLTRALGYEATGENPFKDTKGKWFEKEVQALYEAGIISGTSETTFDPNAYITRQQAAAMLEKVLLKSPEHINRAKLGAVAATNESLLELGLTNKFEATFDDSYQISDYAKNAVGLLQRLDVINGKEGNKFDPQGYLTRAQMAKILTGTLSYTNKF